MESIGCTYPDKKEREQLNEYFQSDEYKQFIKDLAKQSKEPPEFVKNTKCIVQIPYELANSKDFDMKAYMMDCFRNHPERITYKEESDMAKNEFETHIPGEKCRELLEQDRKLRKEWQQKLLKL